MAPSNDKIRSKARSELELYETGKWSRLINEARERFSEAKVPDSLADESILLSIKEQEKRGMEPGAAGGLGFPLNDSWTVRIMENAIKRQKRELGL